MWKFFVWFHDWSDFVWIHRPGVSHIPVLFLSVYLLPVVVTPLLSPETPIHPSLSSGQWNPQMDGCFPRVPLLLYFDHLTVLLFPGAVGHYQREEEEKEVWKLRLPRFLFFRSCRASSDERSLRHHLPPAPIPKGNKSPPSDLISSWLPGPAGPVDSGTAYWRGVHIRPACTLINGLANTLGKDSSNFAIRFFPVNRCLFRFHSIQSTGKGKNPYIPWDGVIGPFSIVWVAYIWVLSIREDWKSTIDGERPVFPYIFGACDWDSHVFRLSWSYSIDRYSNVPGPPLLPRSGPRISVKRNSGISSTFFRRFLSACLESRIALPADPEEWNESYTKV